MMKKSEICVILMIVGAAVLTGCDQAENEILVMDEEKTVLSVLAGQSTSDAGIEDMIDEALAKKFPQVELKWECVDWGEQFDDLMQARISAGDIPDLMVGKAQDVHTYKDTGNLAPLSLSCLEQIDEEAKEAVTVDKKVYGLPYNAWYQGVVYNKELFRKYDLKVPESEMELEEIIRVLKAHQVVPFASHFQESWKIGNMTMQFFMNDIFRKDANWGKKFRMGERQFAGNKKIENCLLNNQKILEASWEDALWIDQYESDKRFSEGEAAMYLTGSWSLQFTSQYSDHLEFGIFPYPNQEGDACLIRETNMTFMKSSKSLHGDLVDQILEYLVKDQDLAAEILEFTQTFSVVREITPGFVSPVQEDITRYENEKKVVDVTIGNAQLIWPFQKALAAEQQLWLQGKKRLQDVLEYADSHRNESSY